jgi:sec-independent protein translocase protein TatA
MGLGAGEIFVIIFAIVLLFGANKIPELARGLGKGLNEFKKATNEIKKEIENGDAKDLADDIKKDMNDIKKNILN